MWRLPRPAPGAPVVGADVQRSMQKSPRIVLVAGEPSGDNLGAKLIEALRKRLPDARFAGVVGPRMKAAGCEAWESIDSLSIMGLFEIIPHLPRLLKLRRQLIEKLLADPPDIYIGVDAKEFNLRLMPALKERGIPTVQYVSPQVWAWRQGRVRTIGEAVDLILCLLPFEKRFYDSYAVHAVFVGHPLADQIPMRLDQEAARRALGLREPGNYVALLPGSRGGEVSRLAPDFAATVKWIKQRHWNTRFIAAMANNRVRTMFESALIHAGVQAHVRIIDGRAQEVMAASDVILLASGTATLEALLVKRPMVVAYRLGMLTSFILKHLKLFKAPFFAQPNLLAGRELVPEYFNREVRAEVLGPALLKQLERADRGELVQTFTRIHETLRRDASTRAAEAIVALMEKRA
jgi:lipid-A-disaccharide synthase